jgi:hypothetical protein
VLIVVIVSTYLKIPEGTCRYLKIPEDPMGDFEAL